MLAVKNPRLQTLESRSHGPDDEGAVKAAIVNKNSPTGFSAKFAIARDPGRAPRLSHRKRIMVIFAEPFKFQSKLLTGNGY